MSRTLQIIELLIAEMEKEQGRYKIEITSKGICIIDFYQVLETKREMPEYYFHFYTPKEHYELECNNKFVKFIGGLKA